MLTNRQIEQFISQQRLPAGFRRLIDACYLPVASWLLRLRRQDRTLLIGVNGAQGTGKSTLAALLQLALESSAGWRVAVLSIDDFYRTKREREQLGASVHPLLRTRGVPGTHDTEMLTGCIRRLQGLAADQTLHLPRFDKAQDDRADPATWPVISGEIELIILEGWCVGSKPQPSAALLNPANRLERTQDPDARWRSYVNAQLGGVYADLFARLEALIFLQAPGFDAVYRWRLEQEQKLASTASANTAGLMDGAQLARFIQHYERITRANLETMPATADVVLELDDNHDCVRCHFTTP